MLIAVTAICMVSCGAEEKVKGDWTIKSINGKSTAEYAASLGVAEYKISGNYTVTADELKTTMLAEDGCTTSKTNKIKMKSNGFECMDGDSVAMSVTYNEGDDTLSFGVNTANGQVDYILKKGSVDLNALYSADQSNDQPAEQPAEEQPAEGGEEQPAEGGEEQPAEGGEEAAE